MTLFPPQDWPHLQTLLAMGMLPFSAFTALHLGTGLRARAGDREEGGGEEKAQAMQAAKAAASTTTVRQHTCGAPLNKTRAVQAELEEGDVLLIPALWFHFVEHEGAFNVNATLWFASPHSGLPNWRPGLFGCRDPVLVCKLVLAYCVGTMLNLFFWALDSATGMHAARRFVMGGM